MKKAVFFDIDGTLWDYDSVIPESAVEGIHRLQKAGNLAFICTGRSRGYIRAENLLSIGFDGIVAGCGTYIEGKDGEILFYKRLDNALVAESVKLLKSHGMATVLEGREYLYMDEGDFENDRFGKKLTAELGERLKSIEGCWGQWEVSKLSSSITAKLDCREAFEAMEKNFDLLIHGSDAVEFVPRGYSKASGIAKVCQLYGIDRRDTFAFGDSINDVEMLRFVNCGIVMGNGTKPAKEAADYITAPLKEDGIYKGLEHFGLFFH